VVVHAAAAADTGGRIRRIVRAEARSAGQCCLQLDDEGEPVQGHRRRNWPRSVALTAALALAAGTAAAAVPGTAVASAGYQVTVLSSAPHQVTGGDARIRVDLPRGVAAGAVVRLNGADVTSSLTQRTATSMEGVVGGLALGANALEVSPRAQAKGAPAKTRLTLVNHPKEGPVFSGPQQYPFVCKTSRPANGLGQPIVDNDSYGFPVRDAVGDVVGYSKDCSAPDRVDYVYRTTAGAWAPLPSGARPANMATTTLMDGRTVDYVVRWERGTINRFVYSIAMLAPAGENSATPDRSLWNGRVTYSFDGGVAIGHNQGELSQGNSFHQSLGKGYAVLSSTGNRTSVHYNLVLGGETALMVKEEFIERHGVPLYTVGVGGSGGGIQQYVYGQNHPGLIDAGVPQYSYPDMVTQTIHVGDCELLEHYMDVLDKANPKWNDVANRQALQGLHATEQPQNFSAGAIQQWQAILQITSVLGGRDYRAALAAGKLPLSECRQGWFGLLPLAMNPKFGSAGAGEDQMRPAGVMQQVHWTHWEDLKNVYGVDPETGFARQTWDNVGVQYGLSMLTAGTLTPDEFLDLNARAGSWKAAGDMVQEGCPFVGAPACLAAPSPATFDPWSSRNKKPAGADGIVPREQGSLEAMRAAYGSGLVFDGDVDIPLIDWRHYREEDLDMHNSHQSFASRQRMLDHDGDASNMVVWFTDGRPSRLSDQTDLAFEVIDTWMANLRADPRLTVAQAKPAGAVDRCFTANGTEIAAGSGVWDGVLDDRPAGACTEAFPLYTTSRIEAGGPIRGGVFKCQLQSVDEALARGVYGSWQPTPEERAKLDAVFPTGVCDYSKPDAGRP
jgi:hypothetical protein